MGGTLVAVLAVLAGGIGCGEFDPTDDGATGSGGYTASGGAFASGGAIGSGGAFASGGAIGSGGAFGTGGVFASGGASTGGAASGGGPNGTGGSSNDPPGPEDGRQIFLLIGQSNMEGVPVPEASDANTNPNIEVLGYDASCKGRSWNTWGIASPPLHRCWAGVGPGDGFAKALAQAWPNAKIALVPCAISGVDIDFFRKGVVSSRRNEFQIPPNNQATGAYQMVLARAQLAQQTGVIRGILFHQGESDSGSPQWVGKVADMVDDLRTDLNLGTDVPFIAGELYQSGCCGGHNTLVNQLPGAIDNAHVVSSAGLAGMDQYHFNLAGQRTLGQRYAATFLEAIGQ
ncbi:MAG TPA: sialate O-acetylesterase [Polyangiaceae bacterium]|nr:sialate O-acetylesterase [Polyangiaceae bacterium]